MFTRRSASTSRAKGKQSSWHTESTTTGRNLGPCGLGREQNRLILCFLPSLHVFSPNLSNSLGFQPNPYPTSSNINQAVSYFSPAPTSTSPVGFDFESPVSNADSRLTQVMQEAGRKQVLQGYHEDTSMLGQMAQA